MKLQNEKGQSFVFSCDWMQYSVLLSEENPELTCPDGYRLEILPGNNVFRYRAIVWDLRGSKWVTLLWGPYSPKLNPRIMTCQVANEHLYDGYLDKSIWLVQSICDCEFNSMGRLDICCDFQPSEWQLGIMNGLATGGMYVQAKQEGAVWWHDSPKKGMNFGKQQHCMNWGAASSDIKVKLYNKSREQGLIGNPEAYPEKPWIVARWDDFDKAKVWRLEFSIKGTGMLRYEGKPISLLEAGDEYFLARMFRDFYIRRFKVRNNEGCRDGHKNADPIVSFLSLPDIPVAHTKWQAPMEPFSLPCHVQLLRKLMSEISNPALVCSDAMFDMYADMIWNICRQYRMESYFKDHYGDEVEPYLNSIRTGEGIVEVTEPNPDKFWD